MLLLYEKNFQTGHMSLIDDPRCGRSSLTDNAATVRKVEDFIILDQKVTNGKIVLLPFKDRHGTRLSKKKAELLQPHRLLPKIAFSCSTFDEICIFF